MKIVKKLIQKGYHHFHTSPQALAVSTCSGEGERTSAGQCREQNQLWGAAMVSSCRWQMDEPKGKRRLSSRPGMKQQWKRTNERFVQN